MQTRVRFIRFGNNTALGNFGPGDEVACGQALARHLVESGVARYVQQASLLVAQPAARAAGKRKARGATPPTATQESPAP